MVSGCGSEVRGTSMRDLLVFIVGPVPAAVAVATVLMVLAVRAAAAALRVVEDWVGRAVGMTLNNMGGWVKKSR